jgi:iron complex transport system ATP-binding protein
MMNELLHTQKLIVGYNERKQNPEKLFPATDISLIYNELTALVGPNGAGKTTLLRTISGQLPAIEGNVFLGESNIKSILPSELAKKISIVLTDRINDPHLLVFDVVAMGRYPYTGFWAKLRKSDREIVYESLHRIGIQEFSKRTFITLSDGEKQKVMIAKALAQDTPIILLDEPAAFLDYPSKIELMHLMQQLVNEHHKTVLYSTHDLDLVLHTADRLWLAGKGKPLVSGIPEQLVLDGFIEAYFSRDSLIFDPYKAQFLSANKPKRSIGLQTEGLVGIWIRNALERKGYVVENVHPSMNISLTDTLIHLTIEGKSQAINSIEELLQTLIRYEKLTT